MTAIRSVVLGCGSYLPERILTNAELATRIDTSDEWIVQRTGIRERHVAAEGEFTSHLAIKAARAALHHARLDAQAIDLIVLATSTPDNTFPATAVAVQEGLGINHGAAFDLQAVCSGFVYALALADRMVGQHVGDDLGHAQQRPGLESLAHLLLLSVNGVMPGVAVRRRYTLVSAVT